MRCGRRCASGWWSLPAEGAGRMSADQGRASRHNSLDPFTSSVHGSGVRQSRSISADDAIGPWMRDALLDAGLPCELARESGDADRRIDAQRPSLVVIPIDQVQRWAALLGQLGQAATGVPVLGAVSRDASIDFTAALALGVTDLVTYPCSTEDLVVRVASSMRAGRRNDRIPERVEPASPLATLRSVTEAAEQALLRTETAAARVSRPEEREHLRSARATLAHSLQVILGTMIGNTEASGHGREGHARLAASLSRELTM